jgi:hypothetical protein
LLIYAAEPKAFNQLFRQAFPDTGPAFYILLSVYRNKRESIGSKIDTGKKNLHAGGPGLRDVKYPALAPWCLCATAALL